MPSKNQDAPAEKDLSTPLSFRWIVELRLAMGVMGSFEKFLVNRMNEYTSERAFNSICDQLHLSENSDTLELGAGKGALSRALYEHFQPKTVTITDYDSAQLEKAKEYFSEKLSTIPSSIGFKTADALHLTFENDSFDAVFAMSVLHHLEKHEWHYNNIPLGLAEIHRVLRSGGFFVYGETFSKKKIRMTLEQIGFEKIFAKRTWGISDLCVYRKK